MLRVSQVTPPPCKAMLSYGEAFMTFCAELLHLLHHDAMSGL